MRRRKARWSSNGSSSMHAPTDFIHEIGSANPICDLSRTRPRLGRGLIMPDPEPNGSQGNGREEVSCELVVARGDAPEVLELVEEALDEVALTVELGIDGAHDLHIALRWDVGGGAAGGEEFDDGACAVAAVGDRIARG